MTDFGQAVFLSLLHSCHHGVSFLCLSGLLVLCFLRFFHILFFIFIFDWCTFPKIFTEAACVDTYVLRVFMISTSGMIAQVCFILLVISYSVILVTVRQCSSGGSSKALSTCSAHFTVVTLFFGPCIFIYVWPFTNFPIDKVLSAFYTIFTPFLNPVIYTLRNKDVKDSMRKLSSCVLKSRKTDHSP